MMLLLIIGAKVATAAADTFQEVRLKKSFIAISMKLEKAKKVESVAIESGKRI